MVQGQPNRNRPSVCSALRSSQTPASIQGTTKEHAGAVAGVRARSLAGRTGQRASVRKGPVTSKHSPPHAHRCSTDTASVTWSPAPCAKERTEQQRRRKASRAQ